MTLEEFHNNRKPFYLDPDNLLVKFPTSKHMNTSHAVWFTDMSYPFLHTVRGYYYKDETSEFIMIYINDFAIPNLSVNVFSYLFEYFPTIQFIGVGCNKGKVGEIWKPQMKILRDNDI